MFFRRKKAQPETLPEKFARLFAVKAEMMDHCRATIEDFRRSGDVRMALENYSHLIHDLCDIAMMRWRQGDDPRAAIQQAHEAYLEMMAYRGRFDPAETIAMQAIAGITDWDLAYALFWLIGEPEAFALHFPYLYSERYFTYSRYILHRTTGVEMPPELPNTVAGFLAGNDQLVDRNFHDLRMLLGDEPADAPVETLVTRVTANWKRRRRAAFYNRSAPLSAGFDSANDLSLDYQLACVVRKMRWQFPDNPHVWRWDAADAVDPGA